MKFNFKDYLNVITKKSFYLNVSPIELNINILTQPSVSPYAIVTWSLSVQLLAKKKISILKQIKIKQIGIFNNYNSSFFFFTICSTLSITLESK